MERKNRNEGQMLIEIIIGIAILAIIGVLITEMSLTGFRGTKYTGVESNMTALAEEGLEAVEAIQAADFHNIYDLTKASQEYYPKISGGVWTLVTTAGDKTVTLDSIDYQRSIIIENVCRATATSNIVTTAGVPPCTAGNADDPSTQKVTVTVTSTGVNDLTLVRYFSRARNSTASQTNWSGGSGQATNPTSGFDATFNTQYDSSDSNLDTAGGTLKLLQ